MAGLHDQSTSALLRNLNNLTFTNDTYVGNLVESGQLGIGPKFPKIDGSTPLVYPPMVFVVLQLPRMFDNFPELKALLKSIIETHAKSITGIDFSYTLNTDNQIVGHDSQQLQTPLNVARSGISPSIDMPETQGNLIFNIIKFWMDCICQADTNSSLYTTFADPTGTATEIDPLLVSTYSMSVLGLQFGLDGHWSNLIDAICILNMFPTGTGEIGFERTIGTTKLMNRTIPFTGIVRHSYKTKELGKKVAQQLQLHRINYNYETPIATGVDGEIENYGIQYDSEWMRDHYTRDTTGVYPGTLGSETIENFNQEKQNPKNSG